MGLKLFRNYKDPQRKVPMDRRGNWNNPNSKQAAKLARRQKAYDDIEDGAKKPQFPSPHASCRPGSMNPQKAE